jgi:hypothetical protein
MTRRCLMLGPGGMARHWIRSFLPCFFHRMELSALVDANPQPLAEGRETSLVPPPPDRPQAGGRLPRPARQFRHQSAARW